MTRAAALQRAERAYNVRGGLPGVLFLIRVDAAERDGSMACLHHFLQAVEVAVVQGILCCRTVFLVVLRSYRMYHLCVHHTSPCQPPCRRPVPSYRDRRYEYAQERPAKGPTHRFARQSVSAGQLRLPGATSLHCRALTLQLWPRRLEDATASRRRAVYRRRRAAHGTRSFAAAEHT